MPRLIVTAGAAAGLERCQSFLEKQSVTAADRAGRAIAAHLLRLEATPQMGRPTDGEMRELVIPFGASGYVALYRFEPDEDAIYLLAFRHQREAGYR
jgi:plasmid stabilization system protein ParE